MSSLSFNDGELTASQQMLAQALTNWLDWRTPHKSRVLRVEVN